ncbi:TPA: PcfJ domain-containing protein [Enterococcus faecium]
MKVEENMNNNETEKTYELRITADEIKSTDPTFTMKNLSLGDNYQPKDAYFRTAEGEITRRNYGKNERKISNQTLPRLAIQMFERSIVSLPESERATFPVCRYHSGDEIIRDFIQKTEINSYKKGKTTIIFMRKKEAQNQLLYTIEYKNKHIVQIQGYQNKVVIPEKAREVKIKWVKNQFRSLSTVWSNLI